MSWFEDLIGKENIAAAQAAYDNSRFKESIDTAKGLGAQAVADIQKYKAENEAKQAKGAAWYDLLGRDMEGPQTQYEQLVSEDKPLEDQSLNMLGVGGIVSKGVGQVPTKVLKVPKGNIAEGAERFAVDQAKARNMRIAQNKAEREANGKAWANSADGTTGNPSVATTLVRNELNSRMRPKGTLTTEEVAAIERFKQGLADRMSPNHPPYM